MPDYQTIRLTPDFTIKAIPFARGFSLSDFEKKLVDRIWIEAQNETAARFYNGQILNFISLEENVLLGEFIDYKFYLAQLRDESLVHSLNIQPIAISGITTTANKVLVGQRSDHVTLYKNFYELVPSGTIDPECLDGDRVDFKKQFEKEVWEESAISVTDMRETNPFALIYDSNRKAYEICAEISVNYLVAKDNLSPSEEYQQLEWVPKTEIHKFAKKHRDIFVPFSLYLLELRFPKERNF